MHTVVAIVEGEGEMSAVPELLKKWFSYRQFTNFITENPAVCSYGCGRLKAQFDHEKQLGIEYFVQNTLPRNPSAIIVILDADRECIERDRNNLEKLGPELLRRANSVANGVPVTYKTHKIFDGCSQAVTIL
ncbi:MAG: hypothetical protein HYX67_03890 [Candidatus Melainabacteria bacterium]|nr:hypothetical protein [Candidatus Melainabacteria bacterium]